jgi:periplasmic protein TonB
MKTNEDLTAKACHRALIVMSAITVILIVLTSCGRNKKYMETQTEIARPPQPTMEATLKDSVYSAVDERPEFMNGELGLLKYIAKNTVYPEDAKKNNIKGKVIVQFVVRKDGSVSNVKILRSVSPSIDAEAIRVVSSLPKFEKPGKQAGTPVSVSFMVPITFALK